LWLIQLIAERNVTSADQGESLPSFSHVMVDEAQQYDPLILRLFRRLARKPFNSITLVGDLKQRLRQDGGVIVWDDLGLPIPDDRRRELLVNYRWSKHTFTSLKLLVKALHFSVPLQRPLRWTSGEGIKSIGFFAESPESEIDEVTQQISKLIALPKTNRWSMALLIPDEYLPRKFAIINSLDGSAINARWAEEADIRAGKEGVTITNSASVVGLEFDAVFILGSQHFLPDNATEVQKQTMWVMATRARQHLCISAAKQVSILQEWIASLSNSEK
jgi:superfamily I DNA/RNA helicase